MADPANSESRLRRRRRFGRQLVAIGAVACAVGVAAAKWLGADGDAIGLVAIAQGIGLVVGGAWLALGRNPYDHLPRR